MHGFLEAVDGIDFQHKVKMGIRNNRYDAMVPQVVAPLKLRGRVHQAEAAVVSGSGETPSAASCGAMPTCGERGTPWLHLRRGRLTRSGPTSTPITAPTTQARRASVDPNSSRAVAGNRGKT